MSTGCELCRLKAEIKVHLVIARGHTHQVPQLITEIWLHHCTNDRLTLKSAYRYAYSTTQQIYLLRKRKLALLGLKQFCKCFPNMQWLNWAPLFWVELSVSQKAWPLVIPYKLKNPHTVSSLTSKVPLYTWRMFSCFWRQIWYKLPLRI